jgi:DNA-binding CsgD family transcriptional regulator
MALVTPVSAVHRLPATRNRGAALVSISDPESTPLPDDRTLREMFGLTPAEARLTRLLAEGTSLAEAAERLGLRRETARTRIKVIFDKTGTHRQAELVSLVMRALPQV